MKILNKLDIHIGKSKDDKFNWRAIVYSMPSYCSLFSTEVSIPSNFHHVYLCQDDENMTLSISSYLLGLWLCIPPVDIEEIKNKNIFYLSVHDGAIWWKFMAPVHYWSNKTPKWKDGRFHVDDLLFGKSVCSKKYITQQEIEIPMPEKAYKAIATLIEVTWKRSRWFSKTIKKVDIEMIKNEQIPIPGKAENSWDCGDDAVFSSCAPAETIEDGIGQFVTSILKTRMKRMGKHRWE